MKEVRASTGKASALSVMSRYLATRSIGSSTELSFKMFNKELKLMVRSLSSTRGGVIGLGAVFESL